MTDLKSLLNIENPSLAQLAETETLLLAAIDETSKTLVALDAEDRGQALNRLRGTDEGAEARRQARENAECDRADAAEVLAGIQAKIAAESERQAAEADAKAWGETWSHLARRRAAMQEVEKLCDKIAGLNAVMDEAYNAAIESAPKKPEERAWGVPAHYAKDVAAAIVVYLNDLLGYQMPERGLESLSRALRVDGMANYLNRSEDRLMGAPVLNRDAVGGK